MEKCNWCGRETDKGIYYGHKWYSSSFYCSNRCLNRAINSGIERPGGKSHSYSLLERIMGFIILASIAIPVIGAILDAIINSIVNLFK